MLVFYFTINRYIVVFAMHLLSAIRNGSALEALQVVVQTGARGPYGGDAALEGHLGGLRLALPERLRLLDDDDAQALVEQHRGPLVEPEGGHAGEAGAAAHGDFEAEEAVGEVGVEVEELEEVALAEHHDGVGVPRLDLPELPLERGHSGEDVAGDLDAALGGHPLQRALHPAALLCCLLAQRALPVLPPRGLVHHKAAAHALQQTRAFWGG